MAISFALAASPALAQVATPNPPPPKASKPDAKTVEGLTVTGAAADVQTSIDRRSYTLGKDVQATSGSIGDALRNVPSVEVDLQGNLSVRGDANVTIMIDGKPSGMFNGSARADALQQLPADQIERVEVITNPSAAENPEGSGGIINLITKKSRGAGPTGSAYALAGSAGLKRMGGSFGYNSKKLSVTGSLAGGYQHNKGYNYENRATLDPASGAVNNHFQDTIGRNLTRSLNGRLNLSYAIDPTTQLTGDLSFNQILTYGYPYNRFEDDDPKGAPVGLFYRQGKRRALHQDATVSADWRHSFTGEGHQLSINLMTNTFQPRDGTVWKRYQVLPAGLAPLESTRQDFDQRATELKVAYIRPLAGAGKLALGYEWRHNDNAYTAAVGRGPSVAGLVPDQTLGNRFLFDGVINSAYATYERSIGDLNVQAGLRLEDLRADLTQATTGQKDANNYASAYPSLHLVYKLDGERKLTASYSRRVQRPPQFLMNSFRLYVDPKTFQQGNPHLAPQNTQSYELAFEQRQGQTLYLATLYYRDNRDEVTAVFKDLGNGVGVVSYDNLGSSRAAGLELVANGRVNKALTYNANANLYWSQINAANLGIAGDRSGFGLGGRANLNWQARPDDLVQLNVTATGKRFYPQGVTEPTWSLNLGWRHKVNDKVTATLSVQDLLDTNRFRRTFDTPSLRDRAYAAPVTRAISLRLDYRFGGKGRPLREPGFEYEGAGAASPPS